MARGESAETLFGRGRVPCHDLQVSDRLQFLVELLLLGEGKRGESLAQHYGQDSELAKESLRGLVVLARPS